MEIKQLKALAAIVETGSFGAAADRLNLTQSAISHQIRHLEEELGETLLVRGKPCVLPSPSGRAVLASVNTILVEINGIAALFSPSDPFKISGKVTVAATSVGMTYLYGDLCEGFMRRYPNIELTFRSAESAEEATKSVEKGAADVGFVPFVHKHPALLALPLGRTEDALIVGRSHAWFKRKNVSIAEVMQWPFVRFLPGSGSRTQSDLLFQKSGYPKISTESNEMEFVKRVVSIGAAMAVIPVMAVAPEVRRRELKALRIKDRPMAVEFGLVHRSDMRLRTLEILKSYCLEMRGPSIRSLSVDNIGVPFFSC